MLKSRVNQLSKLFDCIWSKVVPKIRPNQTSKSWGFIYNQFKFQLLKILIIPHYQNAAHSQTTRPPALAQEEEEVKAPEAGVDGEEEPEPAPTVQVTQPKIFKNLGELINSL